MAFKALKKNSFIYFALVRFIVLLILNTKSIVVIQRHQSVGKKRKLIK